jgi:hypothetical protein
MLAEEKHIVLESKLAGFNAAGVDGILKYSLFVKMSMVKIRPKSALTA